MNKKIVFIIPILVILLLSTSGCLDILNTDNGTVTYVSHPVKVSYKIRYGYFMNTSGNGNYEIIYNCDIPEVQDGVVNSNVLYNESFENIFISNNAVKSWNIKDSREFSYKLGISAYVEAESYLVSNLNGNEASTLDEIANLYSNLINQYCNAQVVDGTSYIDPEDISIKSRALVLKNLASTNNSFILAKKIFIWIKENTEYTPHSSGSNGYPQTASNTMEIRTGDCDDLSFLYISLCRAINIPARFVRGYLIDENTAVAHAWVEVFVGGSYGDNGWIPIECACICENSEVQVNQNFGIESAGHLRLFKDDGTNESLNASISGPRIKYDLGVKIDSTSFVKIDNYMVLDSKELVINSNGIRSYQ
jgi:transglutaminase-like putative cysteine protease